jgi:predicted transcriptional regulator of viral defense system
MFDRHFLASVPAHPGDASLSKGGAVLRIHRRGHAIQEAARRHLLIDPKEDGPVAAAQRLGCWCVMNTLSIIQLMHDTTAPGPDLAGLFEVASSQHGHFTAAQARLCGFGTDLLTHHAKTGRFRRVYRGVYRLRDYPSSPYEDLVAAWLALGRETAVASHESALALHDLSDVIPDAIHLSVPRARRYLHTLPNVRLHTSSRPLDATEIVEREGIRVTAPVRTILDAAEAGTRPEQVQMAIREAVRRALLLPDQLRAAARQRPQRVRALVEDTLDQART